MMVGVEDLYSQDFKNNLYKIIDDARSTFKKEGTIHSDDFMTGYRFNDDNRVLNECLSIFTEKGIPLYFLNINKQQQKCVDFMVKVLFECGKCDYYYKHEKDWF